MDGGPNVAHACLPRAQETPVILRAALWPEESLFVFVGVMPYMLRADIKILDVIAAASVRL